MIGRKCFVPVRYQLAKGRLAGMALEYFSIMDRVGLGFCCTFSVSQCVVVCCGVLQHVATC